MSNDSYVQIVGTSSRYTIYEDELNKSRYVIRGNVCYVNVMLRCVSPTSASEPVCDLPVSSVFGESVQVPILRDYEHGSSSGVATLQKGHLYVKGGTANTIAGCSFSYPV